MSLEDRLANTIRDSSKGRLDLTSDGGEFSDVVVDFPVVDSDWSRIFQIFNKNPDDFEIVDDTVRESTWQQSARTKDGDRDVVQLWSYGARFKRVSKSRLPQSDIDALRARVGAWTLPEAITDTAKGTPCAAVINLADIQGGKSEGGGVAATSQRLLDGLANVQTWLDRVRVYRNVNEVVIVNNGDPLENCAGNYATQLFTVELNLRGQMNFVLDHWSMYAKQLFPQFQKAQFVSVLCNHGEFGRLGGNKNQTSDSDNAGGFLAETLQRVLDRPGFEHVEWTIPHDQMTVYPTIAGVPCAANHGHKVPGADASGFEKWLNAQVRGDAEAHVAKVWLTAHRHNFQVFDLGSTTGFQMPSLDGGSKWLKDMTGKYSRSGIVAMLVGEHDRMGWSDLAFL